MSLTSLSRDLLVLIFNHLCDADKKSLSYVSSYLSSAFHRWAQCRAPDLIRQYHLPVSVLRMTYHLTHAYVLRTRTATSYHKEVEEVRFILKSSYTWREEIAEYNITHVPEKIPHYVNLDMEHNIPSIDYIKKIYSEEDDDTSDADYEEILYQRWEEDNIATGKELDKLAKSLVVPEGKEQYTGFIPILLFPGEKDPFIIDSDGNIYHGQNLIFLARDIQAYRFEKGSCSIINKRDCFLTYDGVVLSFTHPLTNLGRLIVFTKNKATIIKGCNRLDVQGLSNIRQADVITQGDIGCSYLIEGMNYTMSNLFYIISAVSEDNKFLILLINKSNGQVMLSRELFDDVRCYNMIPFTRKEVGPGYIFLIQRRSSPLLDIVVVDVNGRGIYNYHKLYLYQKTPVILHLSVQGIRYLEEPHVFYLMNKGSLLRVTIDTSHELIKFVIEESSQYYLTLPITCGYNKFEICYDTQPRSLLEATIDKLY